MNCFLCNETPSFNCERCDERCCCDCMFGMPVKDYSHLCVKCGAREALQEIERMEGEIEDIECDLDDTKDEDAIEEKREEQADLRSAIQELETHREEAEDRLEVLIERMEVRIADATFLLERLKAK